MIRNPGALALDGDIRRDEIVRIARTWVGTPYHHQASKKGIGSDCLGLIRGVWLELYGVETEIPPAYSRDWAEARGREDLLNGAARHLVAVDVEAARAGDVLVFRMRENAPAKHVGLIASDATFIHAFEAAPACEAVLTKWWRRRIAAAFAFPGVIT